MTPMRGKCKSKGQKFHFFIFLNIFNFRSKKGAWTEEQEDELRYLFEENQRNPQTDGGGQI